MDGQVSKTILLGMNSPQSDDPERALWPWNWASTGGRILKMLEESGQRRGVERFPPEWYVTGFERVNVLDRRNWDAGLARAAAPMIHERIVGRRVVVCGLQTLRVMNMQKRPWMQWNPPGDEVRYCVIPHPSGLTHFYNNPRNRAAVGDFLFDLYVQWISSEAYAAQSRAESPTE